MQKIVLIIGLLCSISLGSIAQTKYPPMDKSPMDMSYYPNGLPLSKMTNKPLGPALARVIYSRPQKNGRTIFGELVEYGKVWRLGANEATEIEFYQNVVINKIKIKKGRYTMYCIPYTDKWTIIFNRDLDSWGSFTYDSKKDVVRLDVAVQKTTEVLDAFTMVFEKSVSTVNVIVVWDDNKLSIPITF
jgi:Protein of unknown function (DUF2911)